mmetsp:Transcript_13090/g.15883  ORF Transcript_13090/g.15883 Transcript_13090/m.15883 type:complete len:223 (+) Transcript_13090:173-841(+)
MGSIAQDSGAESSMPGSQTKSDSAKETNGTEDSEEYGYLVVSRMPQKKLLIPPLNFSLVNKGVYRSGYPNKRNFDFLETIGVRTFICLAAEAPEHLSIARDNLKFIKKHGCRRIEIPIEGQKEPFSTIPEESIQEALRHILDVRNHPVLIHCDKGKHRTGCIIGCLRKLEGWALTPIFREYEMFTKSSARILDYQLIETFSMPVQLFDEEKLPDFLPDIDEE